MFEVFNAYDHHEESARAGPQRVMSSFNGECGIEPNGTENAIKAAEGAKRTTVQHQQLPPRPKLVPIYPSAQAQTPPSCSTGIEGKLRSTLPFEFSGLCAETCSQGRENGVWASIITAPAYAPMQSWLTVMQSLIRHPERNSTNILRADILSEILASDKRPDALSEDAHEKGWKRQWTVRRSLLPRRPNLDWSMLQDCSLYYRYNSTARKTKDEPDFHQQEKAEEGNGAEVEEAVVVYTPLVGDVSHPKMDLPESCKPTTSTTPPAAAQAQIGYPPPHESYIPFYHPKVRALAFHFHAIAPQDSAGETRFGQLGISLIPFSSPHSTLAPPSYPPTHRLSRVSLSLLTTLHVHTWGDLHSYRKRVHHDQIVPRSLYQDVYLSLKAKYASELIAGWKEATDPSKHVFEEMGIAAFLIGLWELHYRKQADDEREWKNSVKFVDVGCGNGLLTHILMREGFIGVGLDMRERKSWPSFRLHGSVLQEWTFNPSNLVSSPSPDKLEPEIWKGAWLIGNHADQLTPWLPLLATHYRSAGFINLPCCYYALDGTRDFPLLLKAEAGENVSRNEQYLAYVSHLHRWSGWKVELDPLRIPSTKNWCFIGRTRETASVEAVQGDQDSLLTQRVKKAVEQASCGAWGKQIPRPSDKT